MATALPLRAAATCRLECAKALLRAGADPNYMNGASDLTLFWALDGGVEMTKLLREYGADLDAVTPKDWTPLSYAKAKGKYGATEEKGIYPEVSGVQGVMVRLEEWSGHECVKTTHAGTRQVAGKAASL